MAKSAYRAGARLYDITVEPWLAALRQIGLRMAPPQPGAQVLDVGCGTGTTLGFYQHAGCTVHGIDCSPAMLRVARAKLGGQSRLRLADASGMPYPDATFDLVTTTLTLHEMAASVRDDVMAEISRVLSPEGQVLITDFRSGPFSFPIGWTYRAVIVAFEIAAGPRHFRNHRDFLGKGGVPGLLTSHGLVVYKEKIVGGGSVGLFLLRSK